MTSSLIGGCTTPEICNRYKSKKNFSQHLEMSGRDSKSPAISFDSSGSESESDSEEETSQVRKILKFSKSNYLKLK